MFKVGEKIVCVRNYFNSFIVGKIYEVTVSNSTYFSVVCIDGLNTNLLYSWEFFRPATLLEKELAEL